MRRNKFSLSHYVLSTVSMGKLYPVAWYETLPGDTFQQSTAAFMRMLELNTPVMHPVKVRFHHWWVPISLIWEDYADFFTGGEDGTATPTHPYVQLAACTKSTIYDYMGIPAQTFASAKNFNALPFRAYNLIYNTKYRDQQLCTELTVSKASGQDVTGFALQRVAWEKDYFTTCRTSEHLGDEVTIPLSGEAPIFGDNMDFSSGEAGNNRVNIRNVAGSSGALRALARDGASYVYGAGAAAGSGELKADLSVSGAEMTLGDLYTAQALQRFQQLRNVYGARYPELIRQAYGVQSRDRRATEPIFLGGGRATMNFSEVIATDGSNSGDLYGHGAAGIRTRRWRRFFDEHGIVMTLASVVPKAIYTESVHRKWLRSSKEDYFTKEFQLIGEQLVTNFEAQASSTTPSATFGYQERYADWKTHPSSVAGDFNDTLNTWHLGREYSGDIALNQSWLECNPSTRIFKSTSTDNIIMLANNSIQSRRQMIKNPTGKAF